MLQDAKKKTGPVRTRTGTPAKAKTTAKAAGPAGRTVTVARKPVAGGGAPKKKSAKARPSPAKTTKTVVAKASKTVSTSNPTASLEPLFTTFDKLSKSAADSFAAVKKRVMLSKAKKA